MENLTAERCSAPVPGANQSQAKSGLKAYSLSAPSCSSCTNSGTAESLWNWDGIGTPMKSLQAPVSIALHLEAELSLDVWGREREQKMMGNLPKQQSTKDGWRKMHKKDGV